MIRPLRTTHRVLISLLAVLLPVLLYLALSRRPAFPVADDHVTPPTGEVTP